MSAQVAVVAGAFVGDWVLLPERSRYELGLPHRDGSYHVRESPDGNVHIESRWTSATGHPRRIAFAGRLDGASYPYTSTVLADALRFALDSPTLLRSSAWKDGRLVQWAERELVDDHTLEIRVHGHRGDGRLYTNVDVYRRA